MNLTLSDIENALGAEITYNGASGDTKVSCVDVDSRKIIEGGVFIATVGERADGHKFIPDVYEKGAVLVIAQKTPEQVEKEHGIDTESWKSYIVVENPFEALKKIAEYYRKKLTIPVVGITGSVGKTSTKEYIAGVLSKKYNVLKTDGNYNNEIGVPLTLLRIREEHEAAVIEMGISDFGEMHRLSKMARPDICVITNIGQCHLENLKTRDGILKAKTEIFDFMNPDGEVCLNGDDDKLAGVREVNGKKVHFFGLDNAGLKIHKEVYAADIESHGLWGSKAKLYIQSADKTLSFPVNVTLPGRHMVINAAAAACVAGLLGLKPEEIKQGIADVKPISGRNNLIDTGRYTLIDDCYNANPVSMKSAIDLLMLADTHKAAILGDMFELGENSDRLHAEVGEYAVQAGVDTLVCVGENSRHMYDAACREYQKQQKTIQDKPTQQKMMQDKTFQQTPIQQKQHIHYYRTRDELLTALARDTGSLIPDNSTILIKASHGMQFGKVLEVLNFGCAEC
jgi:UDP-N-acetylmuramoyl-tripeptide--D-alanyl-D-alanine ligase